MYISVEISYYPLTDAYNKPVNKFIEKLHSLNELDVHSGAMSTIISGPYEQVMELLVTSIQKLMEQYPSVFTLKISNTCQRMWPM